MNKTNQICEIRIRPQRIVFLITDSIEDEMYFNILSYLSLICNGIYSPILVVNGKNDNEIKYNLKMIRPEIIFGYNINFDKWSTYCLEHIQNRYFFKFESKILNDIDKPNKAGIIPYSSFLNYEITREPEKNRPNLVLTDIDKNSDFCLYLATIYGVVPNNNTKRYSKFLKCNIHKFNNPISTLDYLDYCINSIRSLSWLEYINSNLSKHRWMDSDNHISPVIIIVGQNKIQDLSLFWNLRMHRSYYTMNQFMLFPYDEINNKDSVKKLAEWLKSTYIKSSFCKLISVSCESEQLESLARRLRPRLRNFHLRYVDVATYYSGLPEVISYLSEHTLRIYKEDGTISFDLPSFELYDYLDISNKLIVDIVKDKTNQRAPYNLFVPPRLSAIQVLNAPNHNYLSLDPTLIGMGKNSINHSFSKSTEIIKFNIPTDDELLTEIISEKSIIITKDEKRTRYLQSIEIFKDIDNCAKYLSGNSYEVIMAFLKKRNEVNQDLLIAKIKDLSTKKAQLEIDKAIKTIESNIEKISKQSLTKSLSYNEIKSLTNKNITKKSPSNTTTNLIKKFHPKHSSRIGVKRLNKIQTYQLNNNDTLEEILEELSSMGVLHRKWQLDKCCYCEKAYWIDSIGITRTVNCPGCGKQITLKDRIELGYELNELIDLSIREGLIPVILTGKFIKNLSHKSFHWLPGVKCKHGDIKTDLDIVANCDGSLICVECKDLSETTEDSNTWSIIVDQLKNSLDITRLLKADLFIFATMALIIPDHFKNQVNSIIDNNINTLYLNRNDLMNGYREDVLNNKTVGYLSIEDVVSKPSLNKKISKRKPKGTRVVQF